MTSRSADLDDLAEVHDRDPVREVPHHGEVVGDEDERDAELACEFLEQVHDLRLDRHVQRGDRFVGDDQLRAEGEGAGDADALALAAGELMRVAVVVLGVEPDDLQQLLDPGAVRPSGRCCGSASAPPMMVPTVCRGFSDEYGSWKIIWISERIRAQLAVRVRDVAAR